MAKKELDQHQVLDAHTDFTPGMKPAARGVNQERAKRIDTGVVEGTPIEDVSKLKRGTLLYHMTHNMVTFKAKIKGSPDEIMVEWTTAQYDDNRNPQALVMRVRVADCKLTPDVREGKKQGTRMILACCGVCNLKIRASRSTFELGDPLCFNKECENLGKPLELVLGDDAKNIGKLNADMREVGMSLQRDYHQNPNVEFGTVDDITKKLNAKKLEDDKKKRTEFPAHICPWDGGEHKWEKMGGKVECIQCGLTQ